jgi:CheY-like chemotaxis protein
VSGPHILIIDDESDIRDVAQMGLQLISGWVVATASSGFDGVAQASADRPDAILLDVMMPDMDGPETLRLLRADPSTAVVPVVFLTARSQVADMEWLKGLGASGVIPKPFDPITLADDLTKVLGWQSS